MKTPSTSNGWNWLKVFALLIFLTGTVQAQVNFVQVTDPHLFDDTKEDGSRIDDKAAFASFVVKLNQRVDEKAAEDRSTYDFVVVTGDLGLEELVKSGDEVSKANNLKTAAQELASLIGLSKVRTWLFVPGNNDLLDENPITINYYYEFIKALREALKGTENPITIIDLCAEDNVSIDGQSASTERFFHIKKYAFLGFNNASFKNSDPKPDGSPVRIKENFEGQLKNVFDVSSHLNEKEIDHYYIFYHIPEVDDPYFVTLNEDQEPLKTRRAHPDLIGDPYSYSSWFVKTDVRREWNMIVGNKKVKGLFAGHFHDSKKSTYQNFDWLHSHFYNSDTLEKLHVAPPLAVKKQKGQEGQARGFQEVYLDDGGRVSVRTFWLEGGGWNLSSDLAGVEAASLKELELGRTYEGLNRLKEAEAAYLKASESKWIPTRQTALASLKRVVENQDSIKGKHLGYLGVAWSTGLTAFVTALVTATLALGSMGLLSILLGRYWKRQGRHKLKIGPFLDSPNGVNGSRFEQVLKMIHGRLRTHFKPRKLVKGVPRLPMIAKSQSADVLDLAESVAPGIVGKSMVWLLKKKDQSQYSIDGVTESRRIWDHYVIFVSLRDNHGNRLLKHWHKLTPTLNIITDERNLAFDVLKRLVRYMHK